jgi:hypothetical protein
MHMNGWNRAMTTLLAAAAAGFLLWLAAQFNMHNTGGYWAALGIVAGCGFLLGLAQLRGSGGHPPAMLMLTFLPVLICAGWILIYAEPHTNWFRTHVGRWSGDIGIRGVVHDVSMWNGVLAFGIGLVFAYVLEPRMLMRKRETAVAAPVMPRRRLPVFHRAAADEPMRAEKAETESIVERPATDRDTTTVG